MRMRGGGEEDKRRIRREERRIRLTGDNRGRGLYLSREFLPWSV